MITGQANVREEGSAEKDLPHGLWSLVCLVFGLWLLALALINDIPIKTSKTEAPRPKASIVEYSREETSARLPAPLLGHAEGREWRACPPIVHRP